MSPQDAFTYSNHGSRSMDLRRDSRLSGLANPMIRPPKSEIAREDKIWVKEWAHWRHYHAILTYNFDQTGVLQLYRHEHDADPHRLIQMIDFVKVYPSRNSSSRYEFTIEEKNGLEIVMATDNSGDRSAWITSFNMFIKMEKLTLNLDAIDENSKVNAAQVKVDDGHGDLEFIKNEILCIKNHLLSNQETSILSKISNQLEKQNSLLEQLLPKASSEGSSNIPDRSTGYLMSNMNDKLTRLLSAIDYVTDRLSTSLKRDQDILKSQNQIANQLDQNNSELKLLKNSIGSINDTKSSLSDFIECLESKLHGVKSVRPDGSVHSSETVFESEC